MLLADPGVFALWPKGVLLIFSVVDEDSRATNPELERVAAGQAKAVVPLGIGLLAALAEEERVGDRAVDTELASLWLLYACLISTKLDSG